MSRIASIKQQQAAEAQASKFANGRPEDVSSFLQAEQRDRRSSKQSAAPSDRVVLGGQPSNVGGGRDDNSDDEEEGAIWKGKGSGEWVPGQGVPVHYREIVDILLQHVSYPGTSCHFRG